jgi:hypothetical protein
LDFGHTRLLKGLLGNQLEVELPKLKTAALNLIHRLANRRDGSSSIFKTQ